MGYKSKKAKAKFDKAWKQKRTGLLSKYKTERGCQICGEVDPRCLEFHHPTPTEKKGGISAMRMHSLKKLMIEVAKCMVICANCHRKVHIPL